MKQPIPLLRAVQRASSAVWAWRHASLMRRIDLGAVATRVEHGWVQVQPQPEPATGSPVARIWMHGRASWQVELGPGGTHGWGVMGAQVVFVDTVPWPVLAHTRDGLILPTREPIPLVPPG